MVDLQLDWHAGHAQAICPHHAVVKDGIAFGQADPGRRHAIDIVGMHRGKAPVHELIRLGDIAVEHPLDLRLGQQKAVGVCAARWRQRRGLHARVEQQLQAQRQTGIARLHGAARCQRAAGAVTAHGDAFRIQAEHGTMFMQPGQAVPGILESHRELVFRAEPVIDRYHGAAAVLRQRAAQRVMRIHAADQKAAAMEEQQHRQHALLFGRGDVQARRHRVAVTRRHREILDTRQLRRRNFEHAGAAGIGGTRFLHRQRFHWRARMAVDADQQIAHMGLEAGPGLGIDSGIRDLHIRSRG